MTDADTRRGPAIEPREIVQEGERALLITWADGRQCRFAAADLRRACPCARCVNEWTGERVLSPESVPEELTDDGVQIVGRYAVNFRWGDGHQTGI